MIWEITGSFACEVGNRNSSILNDDLSFLVVQMACICTKHYLLILILNRKML